MQITVKSIDKSVRVVEGDFQTVLDVSEKLAADHGFDVACQVLIFQGKMLKPTDPVVPAMGENFMVLTMKKPKVPKPAEEAAPAPAVAAPPAQESVAEPAAEAVAAPAIPQNPSVPQNPAAEEAPPAAEEAEPPTQEMIDNLVAVGFSEAQVRIALRLSRNDPQIAGQLLMEPEMMLQAQQMEASGQSLISQDGGQGQGALTESQVMTMMESNPEMLQGLIQAISQGDPDAAQQLQANPEAFLQFLTQFLNQHGGGMGGMMGGMGGDGGDDEGADQAGAGGQGQGIQIPMTPEETEEVNNLVAMFPHIPQLHIVQAYKACDSNANNAASMLFDYNPDDN